VLVGSAMHNTGQRLSVASVESLLRFLKTTAFGKSGLWIFHWQSLQEDACCKVGRDTDSRLRSISASYKNTHSRNHGTQI
jgi:hypothetical protein